MSFIRVCGRFPEETLAAGAAGVALRAAATEAEAESEARKYTDAALTPVAEDGSEELLATGRTIIMRAGAG